MLPTCLKYYRSHKISFIIRIDLSLCVEISVEL